MSRRPRLQAASTLRYIKSFSPLAFQKVAFLGSEEDGRYADDIIHSYRFEGAGSAAGSVGCCSDYGENNDLDFLNGLGPKFKTLADVCTKK